MSARLRFTAELWRHTRSSCRAYLLPMKADVRANAAVTEGDVVEVELDLLV